MTKPAAAVPAAATLGFPYCNRCLSFTYFGFGMGFGFGFGQPPGREEIKIYIAYKAGQLLLARQGILLFSMFLNLASFTSIRSFVFLCNFLSLPGFHLKLAAAKAESVAAIKLPIDHLSASIAAKEAQEKIYDCCQVVANGFELG